MLCGHLFGFLCLSIYSASSASMYPALYVFFPHPPAPGLCRMQTERASGIEVLLAFGPPIGPSPAQPFGVASAASGFPKPFRVSAILFRRLDSHQSCALAPHYLKGENRLLEISGVCWRYLWMPFFCTRMPSCGSPESSMKTFSSTGRVSVGAI